MAMANETVLSNAESEVILGEIRLALTLSPDPSPRVGEGSKAFNS